MKDSEIVKQIEQELGSVKWKELAPHLARDSIIIVATSLSLAEVGAFVVKDNQEKINSWIEAGLLVKPSLEQIDTWQKEDPSFICSIVQPFVLIQLAS